MKAITIRQPWAWAIFNCGKDIENRDWFRSIKGRVAVHAAKGMTKKEYADGVLFMLRLFGYSMTYPTDEQLDRGAIIGTVEIVGCVKQSKSPWFVGDYGFVLRDPIVLPSPIPCSGALGFWDVPAEIERQLKQSSAQRKTETTFAF